MSELIATTESSPASRLMVLMFTDAVGSTEMKRRLGDSDYARLINQHDALFKRIIAATPKAEILKDVGDGFLARFNAPSDAINAGLRFQYALRQGDWQPQRIDVRIGLHLGEVTEIDEDHEGQRKVVGLPADIAARVMNLAQGGQILLTRAAFDSARQNIRRHPSIAAAGAPTGATPPPPEIKWMAYGRYAIKGIEEPIEIFEVGAEGVAPFKAPPDNDKARRAFSLEEEATLGWRPAAGLQIPRRPGWIIDRKLGEGGFGEVWLGKHGKTFDQRVFKFCFDAERLRSFKRELTLFRLIRHALGDRKDIAKLHEVQLESAPYFLESEFSEMGDLVDWSKTIGGIDKFPMAQRIDMVARIAEAVAAAHSVGVLHKDIKPSNILVRKEEGGQVRPVLADFGIGVITDTSRISDLRMTTGSGFTETVMANEEASRTGTRMYAPPEILANKPFTVQGDVYALGVLLYQMAAGDLDRPLASGWERDVEDELVREDIAACVEGDPRRRLASVAELASRLKQLPERRLRRQREADAARTLARKRRLTRLAIAGVVVLCAGAAALGLGFLHERGLRERAVEAEKEAQAMREQAVAAAADANTQRLLAVQSAQRATVLSSFFRAMLESANPNNAKTGEVSVKQLLDEAAEGAQQRFASDPTSRAEIMHTLGVTYGALGQWTSSEKLLAAAVEIRKENLGEKNVDTLASMHQLATALTMLNKPTEAIELKRTVFALRKEVLGRKHRDTLASQDSLAQSLYYSGDRTEGERMRREVLDLRRSELGEEDPDTLASMFNLATMAMDAKDYAQAQAMHERVLELREKVQGPQHSDTLASRTSVARVLASLGKHAEAEATLRSVVELQTKRFGADHLTTLMTRITLASALVEAKKPVDAEAMLRDVLAVQQKSDLPRDHWSTLRARQGIADALAAQDKPAEAEAIYREVLAVRLKMPGGDRSRATLEVMRSLAAVLEKSGKAEEAKDLRARADDAEKRRPPR
jgi:serine/threonine-protein kinase